MVRDAASIRDWVLGQLTLHIDNYEPWYVRVSDAADAASAQSGGDSQVVGEAVADEVRAIIKYECADAAEVESLLLDLLDLNDSVFVDLLGAHYSEG